MIYLKKVWKYPLPLEDKVVLRVPGSFKLLHVGYDPQKTLCVWGEVANAPTADIEYQPLFDLPIWMCATRQPIPDEARTYRATILDGPRVWHIYTL